MSPQQFFSLDRTRQCQLLEAMPHASERFEPGFMIMLFQMDGWLLEATYHRRAGFVQFEELTPALAAQRFSQTEEPGRLPVLVQASRACLPRTNLLQKVQYHFQQLLNLVLVPGNAQSMVRSKVS